MAARPRVDAALLAGSCVRFVGSATAGIEHIDVDYEILPEWKLGVESWGGADLDHTDELAASVGPALSWAPASTLWITTTAGFGVTDFADDFSVRAILGVDL